MSGNEKNKARFLRLLEKYVSGRASDAEKKFVDDYMDSLDSLSEEINISEIQLSHIKQTKLQLFEEINKHKEKAISVSERTISIPKKILVAASVLIFLGLAAYWFFSTKYNSRNLVKNNLLQDSIQLVTNKAILTLSDGRSIMLNDSGSEIIEDGKVLINKNSGLLAYDANQIQDKANVVYNLMTTPKGAQYQLILPDGSKVWLNSASKIKYPTTFAGNERTVELEGEAYFDIKENKSQSFVVVTKKMKVNVLGTGFNVNAYEDEPVVATTLIHGSVKIITESGINLLKPGQQSALTYASSTLNVSKANTEEVLAWKEGKLRFEGAGIQNIMRQIARWYDVKVEYRGDIPKTEFAGSILKTEYPSTLLKVLEITKEVHFIVEGKKIIVVAGPKK
jgi:transmembrane sensor